MIALHPIWASGKQTSNMRAFGPWQPVFQARPSSQPGTGRSRTPPESSSSPSQVLPQHRVRSSGAGAASGACLSLGAAGGQPATPPKSFPYFCRLSVLSRVPRAQEKAPCDETKNHTGGVSHIAPGPHADLVRKPHPVCSGTGRRGVCDQHRSTAASETRLGAQPERLPGKAGRLPSHSRGGAVPFGLADTSKADRRGRAPRTGQLLGSSPLCVKAELQRWLWPRLRGRSACSFIGKRPEDRCVQGRKGNRFGGTGSRTGVQSQHRCMLRER